MASNNIPSTINNVYIYLLNSDGTVTALNNNELTTLTSSSGGDGVISYFYTDSSGSSQLLYNVDNTALAEYQTGNSFITYDSNFGYILVSNDIIETPSAVSWSNQSGETPNSITSGSFEDSTTSLAIKNTSSGTAVNESLPYEKVDGGSTGDGIYDTTLHYEMPCFLVGTMILTKEGYKPVETLNLQDQIATIKDGIVEWSEIKALAVGKHKIHSSPFPDIAGYPVRITKGAISPGVPFKDLLVTHDHALFVENKLLLARTLVDGENIYFDKAITEYDFYYIDLYDHVIIEADGLQVESFNSKGHKNIFGNLKIKENTSLSFTHDQQIMEICTDPTIIQEIREKINLKNNQNHTTNNEGISFNLTDSSNQKIEKKLIKKNLYSFTIPPGINEVNIVSDVFRPYDAIGPHVDDRRLLGVLVEQVTLIEHTNDELQKDHLHEQSLKEWSEEKSLKGWSGLNDHNCRWTTGNALLHLERKNPNQQAELLIKFLNEVN